MSKVLQLQNADEQKCVRDIPEFTHWENKVALPWETILIVGLFVALIPWAKSTSWNSNSDIHTCVETGGALFAVLGGIVCLIYYFGFENRFFLVVGLGFFLAGAEDFIHGLLSFPAIFENSTADLSRFIPATYSSGRFYLALMILFAPLIENRVVKRGSIRKEAIQYSSLALILGGGITFLAINISLPQMIFPDSLISRPLDLITGFLFLIALFPVWRRYRANGDIFTRMLFASILFNIGAQLYMTFSKQLFDPYFDIAHTANVFSYVTPLLGIALSGLQEMKKSQLEVFERIEIQEELARSNITLQENLNELWRTRSKHELVIQSIDEGIVVVDQNDLIMTANSKATLLLGLQKTIAPGQILSEIFEQCLGYSEVFEKLKDESPSLRFEFKVDQDNPRTLNLRRSSIIINNSETLGKVYVFRDVTKEKEIEKMKDQFIASVSHELRTPLTSIKGFTATILRDPEMPEDTRTRFLRIIDKESTRLGNLIENLLSLSQLGPQKAGQKNNVFRLKETLHKVVVGFEQLAREKGVTFKTSVPETLPDLIGDSEEIQAVFVNLVGNALKFTPENGTIFLEGQADDTAVCIKVIDTGPGIPESEHEKIFDRFYRIHQPGIEVPGTGLGLSLVKEILDMHQSKIEVENTPDGGACFSVFFPKSRIEHSAHSDSDPEPAKK